MVSVDIYKECFNGLTEEESYCASMCESMIAYGDGLGSYADKRYLTKYRVGLGDSRVNDIYNKLSKYIKENYVLHIGTFTDSDGISYNSFVKKGVK